MVPKLVVSVKTQSRTKPKRHFKRLLKQRIVLCELLSDEEILATSVRDSMESKSVCSDDKDKGEDEKLVSG